MMTTIELFPLQNKTEMNSTAVIADEFHNSVGYKISLREMLTGTDEYYQISSGLMISDNRSSEREQKQRQPGSWDQCDANQKRLILYNTQPTELFTFSSCCTTKISELFMEDRLRPFENRFQMTL